MKFISTMGSKTLCLVMLTFVMLSSAHTAEAASGQKDVFSAFKDIESLLKTFMEPAQAPQNLNFEETVMKGEHSKNSHQFESLMRGPIVGEDTTLYNTWNDKWFTATIYNIYLTAFQSGLKLSSYYDYSTQCISGF